MSDIFGIAKSGLQAYKEGLATTGQNIANVGNDSYARREAPISEVTSGKDVLQVSNTCLLYTSPSPRDGLLSRMPSSA